MPILRHYDFVVLSLRKSKRTSSKMGKLEIVMQKHADTWWVKMKQLNLPNMKHSWIETRQPLQTPKTRKMQMQAKNEESKFVFYTRTMDESQGRWYTK